MRALSTLARYGRLSGPKALRSVLIGLAVGLLVGLGVMHSRSSTLTGVRHVDERLIVDLVHATVRPDFGEAQEVLIEQALAGLEDPRCDHAYVGVAVWRGDEQLAANHELLQGLSAARVRELGAGDPRYRLRTLDPVGDDKTWNVAFFRPELAYDFSACNFIWVPIAQWLDPYSVEVRTEVFGYRFLPHFAWTFIFVTGLQLVIAAAARCRERTLEVRRRRLKRSLQRVDGHRAALRVEARRLRRECAVMTEIVEEAGDLEKAIATKEGQLAEATRQIEQLERRLEKAESKRTLRLPRDGWIDDLTHGRVGWLPGARREARMLLGRLERPARVRLARFLAALSLSENPAAMPRHGFPLQSMEAADVGGLWHEAGKQPFKLYVAWNGGRPVVTAAATGGSRHLNGHFLALLRSRAARVSRAVGSVA